MTDPDALEADRLRQLADACRAKALAGETPTQGEISALRKVEDQQREEHGLAFVASVPKKTYVAWADRPLKTVNQHADLYSLPLRGRTVDLPEAIKQFHAFLVKNYAKLQYEPTPEDDDEARRRKAKADREEYQRDLERGQLIPLADAREIHERWAHILRDAGERLGRAFGPDAQDLLNEALDDCAELIKTSYPA